MVNYNWIILGDMFRPLNCHPQASLEQCWPEDDSLTAETCRQE